KKNILTKTNEKGVSSIVKLTNFAQFMNSAGKSVLSKLFEYKTANTNEPVPFAEAKEMDDFKEPTLRNVDFPIQAVEEKRASKTSLTPANEAAVQYGTHLHRLLELVSFKKKDASFIKNEAERKKIEALFNNSIFDNLEGFHEFHEYRYLDYKNDLEGSIDLLLVKEGEKAMIIDYKTKSLDDEAYERQLGLYKEHIEKVFGLKTETYLLSISDNVLKVVE
ncbi:MAG: PD-(D/E)XK nuclease family protein, partial [Bacilli bacterium]|nr:PD-(D/E)XK nuclease family protein [Bacilli bacterium]